MQPVYKQLGLELQKIKQLLGLKHITISNFANKIFAYENIATTLHNHILYTANVNQYIQGFFWFHKITPYLSALVRSTPVNTPVKKMATKKLKNLSNR